jgi:mono/diheme cytochrome c family protein
LFWVIIITPCAAQDAAVGRTLYGRLCVHCHGPNMVNPGISSFDLRRFPQDDKARFVNSVTKGKGSMPPFDGKIAPEEIENLWAYVVSGGKT